MGFDLQKWAQWVKARVLLLWNSKFESYNELVSRPKCGASTVKNLLHNFIVSTSFIVFMKNFLMCKFQTENQLFKYKLKGMIKLYKTPKPIKKYQSYFRLDQTCINLSTCWQIKKKIVMNLGQLTSNIFSVLRSSAIWSRNNKLPIWRAFPSGL